MLCHTVRWYKDTPTVCLLPPPPPPPSCVTHTHTHQVMNHTDLHMHDCITHLPGTSKIYPQNAHAHIQPAGVSKSVSTSVSFTQRQWQQVSNVTTAWITHTCSHTHTCMHLWIVQGVWTREKLTFKPWVCSDLTARWYHLQLQLCVSVHMWSSYRQAVSRQIKHLYHSGESKWPGHTFTHTPTKADLCPFCTAVTLLVRTVTEFHYWRYRRRKDRRLIKKRRKKIVTNER